MRVTEKDVALTAGLANLGLTEAERVRLLRERLNEVDTTSVPPMTQMPKTYSSWTNEAASGVAAAGREDIPEGLRPSLSRDVALRGAPGSDGTFFKVPKVIER